MTEAFKLANALEDVPSTTDLCDAAALLRSQADEIERLSIRLVEIEKKASYVVKRYSYGGITGINDYLMSDGSIKAMTCDEAKAHAESVQKDVEQMISNSQLYKLKKMQQNAPNMLMKTRLCAQVVHSTLLGDEQLFNEAVKALKLGLSVTWSQSRAFQFMAGKQALLVCECASMNERASLLKAHEIAKNTSALIAAREMSYSSLRELFETNVAKSNEVRAERKDGVYEN